MHVGKKFLAAIFSVVVDCKVIDSTFFSSGGKTAQRNVEITMCVVTDKGRIINVS